MVQWFGPTLRRIRFRDSPQACLPSESARLKGGWNWKLSVPGLGAVAVNYVSDFDYSVVGCVSEFECVAVSV